MRNAQNRCDDGGQARYRARNGAGRPCAVPRGGTVCRSAQTSNLTYPFGAMVRGLYTDFHKMSWTHLGMWDINLIEFIALATFVVAGFLVLRSTTAPLHERVAFVCFVLIEMVMASWQFWGSTFGDGRTYIDAFLLSVILLLATPARGVGDRGRQQEVRRVRG